MDEKPEKSEVKNNVIFALKWKSPIINSKLTTCFLSLKCAIQTLSPTLPVKRSRTIFCLVWLAIGNLSEQTRILNGCTTRCTAKQPDVSSKLAGCFHFAPHPEKTIKCFQIIEMLFAKKEVNNFLIFSVRSRQVKRELSIHDFAPFSCLNN